MNDKTIQEVMWDVEQMLYSCKTTGELKVKILQIAMENFPYEDDEEVIVNMGRIKQAVLERMTCKNNPSKICRGCEYEHECKLIYSMINLAELLISMSIVPSNIRIEACPVCDDVIEQ